MEPAITVRGVSKKYQIGKKQKYLTLRDSVMSFIKKPKLSLLDSGDEENSFWALKDVSFEVKPGEILGIIGPNGAGKSTLLKILTRTTYPSSGEIHLRGKVASLLEVGTGFHQELTGRENIFLNGAILGMKQEEIRKKFDEIVAFSGIEAFLDTPVKHYSSGMYVRLAFSVAAHLDSEILLVDEVLAVGDIEFQKKSLGRMEQITKQGRTILFVSHNMQAIKALCHRVMLFNGGKITADADAASVVANYLGQSSNEPRIITEDELGRLAPRDQVFKLKRISLNQEGRKYGPFASNKDIEIVFEYQVYRSGRRLFLDLEIWDTERNWLVESLSNADKPDPIVAKGSYVTRAIIPANTLTGMTYELRLEAGLFGQYNFTKAPVRVLIEVCPTGSKSFVYSSRPIAGKINLPIKWQTRKH